MKMEIEPGLLDHLSDGLLDVFHVRSLHAVAAGAARHPTAAWCVPVQYFIIKVQEQVYPAEQGHTC